MNCKRINLNGDHCDELIVLDLIKKVKKVFEMYSQVSPTTVFCLQNRNNLKQFVSFFNGI